MWWDLRDVERRLDQGEKPLLAFPARYPWGPLPFEMLFTGAIVPLTDRRIAGLGYGRLSSRPDRVMWSIPRESCVAALRGERLELRDAWGPWTRHLLRRRSRTAEARRLVRALAD